MMSAQLSCDSASVLSRFFRHFVLLGLSGPLVMPCCIKRTGRASLKQRLQRQAFGQAHSPALQRQGAAQLSGRRAAERRAQLQEFRNDNAVRRQLTRGRGGNNDSDNLPSPSFFPTQ